MEIYKKIFVNKREVGKKSFIKKLFKTNLVPGVIYLKDGESACISVTGGDAMVISNDPSAMTRLYEIDFDGKKIICILKEMQFNPLNDTPRSVDFMEVRKGDFVKVNVPIRVINKDICPGVKSGGDIYLLSYNVFLKCNVENIPYAIEIDVKDCDMGQKFFLSDIKLPDGCKMINDTILLRIAGRRIIKELEETATTEGIEETTTETSEAQTSAADSAATANSTAETASK